MQKLEPGIYEQVINEEIAKLLEGQKFKSAALDSVKAPEALSAYLKDIIRRVLRELQEQNSENWEKNSVAFVNRLLEAISTFSHAGNAGKKNLYSAELLKEVTPHDRTYEIPGTSIAENGLIIGNNEKDPTLSQELQKEISSADEICWMVSFIRMSGMNALLEPLKEFVKHGKLRVLTTTYIGATEPKALQQLVGLGENSEVRIEYDGEHSRLHAKVYYFKRKNGFSTAYIGSSNISKDALRSGLEWNVKLTQRENPALFEKIDSYFNTSWLEPTFVPFRGTEAETDRLKEALKRSKGDSRSKVTQKYFFDLKPFLYQEEILEAIEAQRAQGLNRNLVVAATGTGKTAIAAFDYRRLCEKEKKRLSLLFVAHRKEILQQARLCFQEVLHDDQFGELWVDGERPEHFQHLFASVQSLNARGLDEFDRNRFEMVIIDEAHHMAAASYRRILSAFSGARYLLGLTATPERADGQKITDDFDHRITAEIRLPDAIDRQLLVPFNYFIQDDPVSLENCRWVNGGYDPKGLEESYTQGKEALKRLDKIIAAVRRYLPDGEDLKAIAFCAGIRHAEFMASAFNEAGFSARSISGATSREDREKIREDLRSGNVQIVTAVDVFNEGVDLPFLNSVLFLRPTQSVTVFLQQLGRGLRLCAGKDALTVLDFVGVGNARFNYERRFRELFRTSSLTVGRQIEREEYYLPIGCTFEMQKTSHRIILENIRKSYSGLSGVKQQLAWFAEGKAAKDITLSAFLEHLGWDPLKFYSNIKTMGSFTGLLQAVQGEKATLPRPSFCSNERQVGSLFIRFSQLDDRDLTQAFSRLLEKGRADGVRDVIRRLFYAFLKPDAPGKEDPLPTVEEALHLPWLRSELRALLAVMLNRNRLPLKGLAWRADEDVPLQLHGTYTKAQIFTALCPDIKRAPPTGVFYDAKHRLDLLFVTINKSEKNFAPNTLYDDYAVNHELFHWESQSTTTSDSETGRRYIAHKELGSRVLLFVRERKDSLLTGDAEPYRCFGFCQYLSHESERPMKILWRLEEALPAKLVRMAKPINAT